MLQPVMLQTVIRRMEAKATYMMHHNVADRLIANRETLLRHHDSSNDMTLQQQGSTHKQVQSMTLTGSRTSGHRPARCCLFSLESDSCMLYRRHLQVYGAVCASDFTVSALITECGSQYCTQTTRVAFAGRPA